MLQLKNIGYSATILLLLFSTLSSASFESRQQERRQRSEIHGDRRMDNLSSTRDRRLTISDRRFLPEDRLASDTREIRNTRRTLSMERGSVLQNRRNQDMFGSGNSLERDRQLHRRVNLEQNRRARAADQQTLRISNERNRRLSDRRENNSRNRVQASNNEIIRTRTNTEEKFTFDKQRSREIDQERRQPSERRTTHLFEREKQSRQVRDRISGRATNVEREENLQNHNMHRIDTLENSPEQRKNTLQRINQRLYSESRSRTNDRNSLRKLTISQRQNTRTLERDREQRRSVNRDYRENDNLRSIRISLEQRQTRIPNKNRNAQHVSADRFRSSNSQRTSSISNQLKSESLQQRNLANLFRSTELSLLHVRKNNITDSVRVGRFSTRNILSQDSRHPAIEDYKLMSKSVHFGEQMKFNILTNTVQIVLVIYLLAQTMDHSSKTKKNWFHNLRNFVTVTKEKVL